MRTNKILATLLVFALVVTLVAPSFAFAATPTSDVTDVKERSAVAKLAGLGIVDGYEDGTYRPGNDLTRAEFAKLIAVAAGYDKAAESLAGQPTGFGDLAADHWASGYVAAATALGYLKGDPDGNFRPNANIKYSEAVTVMMRTLGYKDEYLAGTWPSNFVIQADKIGLLEEIADSFSINAPIKRGAVAVLVSETLDADMVEWNDNTKDIRENGKKLLTENFKDELAYPGRLMEVSIEDKEVVGTLSTFKFAEEFDPTGVIQLRGHAVVLVVNDKQEVVAVSDNDDKKWIVSGTVKKGEFNAGVDVKLNGQDYKTWAAIPAYFNGKKENLGFYEGKIAAKGISTKIFYGLDSSNNRVAQFIIAEDYNLTDLTITNIGETNSIGETLLKTKKVLTGGTTNEDFRVTKNTLFTVNGKEAAFEDLKVDYVINAITADGRAVKVDAYDKSVTGTVTRVTEEDNVKNITLDGTVYKSIKNLSFAPELGKEYTLYMGKDDKVARTEAVDGASTKFVGVVVKVDGYSYLKDDGKIATVAEATILTQDGNIVQKAVKDAANTHVVGTRINKAPVDISVGGVYYFTLKKDKIESAVQNNTEKTTAFDKAFYTDVAGQLMSVTKNVKADDTLIAYKKSNTSTGNFQLAENVVVYALSGDKEFRTNADNKVSAIDFTKVKATDIKLGSKADIKKDSKVLMFGSDATDVVSHIVVFNAGTSEEDKLPTITGVYKRHYAVTELDANGDTVDATYTVFYVNGEEVTIKYDITTGAAVNAGELVTLIDKDEKGKYDSRMLASRVLASSDKQGVTNAVYSVGDNSLVLGVVGGDEYVLTSNTKYYVVKLKTVNPIKALGNLTLGSDLASITSGIKDDIAKTGEEGNIVQVLAANEVDTTKTVQITEVNNKPVAAAVVIFKQGK